MISTFIVAMLWLAGASQDDSTARRSGIEKPAARASLDEYNAMRAKAPNTADGHWKVGLWCEQKGLKEQAEMEFLVVCQLDPNREAAWKKLGYLKQNGKWTTPAKIAAERAEADGAEEGRLRTGGRSFKAGRPGWPEKRNGQSRNALLAAIKDPRAVPSIWKMFATGGPEDQEMAIDMLGHIEGERPSRAPWPAWRFWARTRSSDVRRPTSLARRDHMDVLMNWIGLLHDPIKYEVKQVAGPGMPGTLLVEGEEFKMRRFYMPPTSSQIGYDALRACTGPDSAAAEDRFPASLATQAWCKANRQCKWCAFVCIRLHLGTEEPAEIQ